MWKQTIIRRLVAIAIAGLMVSLAGCGGDKGIKKVALVSAKGKISYKGKPPVGARVVLLPSKDESPDAIKPYGFVAEDGTFELTTYPSANGKPDGAPPGDYLVSIRWTARSKSAVDEDEGGPPGPPGGVQRDRLGDRYSNPKTSGLRLTVAEGRDLEPIELK
ncbi:hypothetical protein [Zavarzinella formosa]|uniref:hypothetical protein n=1 Tax=Zavarzinella formosa TaxID=360055 RepID=UPI0002F34A4C|nr:hypothetical protein [Zavarzinella formosa]